MPLSPVFDIARGALSAQEIVIQTVGQNLANVSRPSYSRQEVVLVSQRAQSLGGLLVGGGVGVAGVRQAVDSLVEAQLLRARSRSSEADATRRELSQIEGFFSGLDGSGLQEALDGFFAGANELALRSQGVAERSIFLAKAETLAGRIRQRASELSVLQRQIDDQIVGSIPRVNGLLDEIAKLNTEILRAEIGENRTANDLRDQRRDALGKLTELVGVSQFETPQGVTVVGPAGVLLVEYDKTTHLVADSTTAPTLTGLDGLALAQVGFQTANGDLVALTGAFDGGSLGGLLSVRDTDIPAIMADLNQLAGALRDSVNAIHTNGEDLDGNVGEALFGGTAAIDLSVLITDARLVAASFTTGVAPNTPEDNRNALALAALAATVLDGTDATLGNADLDGSTFIGFLSTIVGTIGSLSETAIDRAESAEALKSGLENRRAAISGVSTNEELLTLLEAQRSFQAAATLVNVATATIDAILSMVS